MALLPIVELSRVFWKKIFRALGFSSCCCSDLEMLAAEIFRIYSDASFTFALWARVEFRSTVSIHGFESGLDVYHTYMYNSIPEPPHLLLPAQQREFPVLLNGGFAEKARGQSCSRNTHSRNCLAIYKPTSVCPAVLSCIQTTCFWFLWAPAASNAPSYFQSWKQRQHLCHPHQRPALLTPGGKTFPSTSSKYHKTIVTVGICSWPVPKDVPAGMCCGEPWGPGPHHSGQGLVGRTHSPHPACACVSSGCHIQVEPGVTRHVGQVLISSLSALAQVKELRRRKHAQSLCILNLQGLCFPRIGSLFLSNRPWEMVESISVSLFWVILAKGKRGLKNQITEEGSATHFGFVWIF